MSAELIANEPLLPFLSQVFPTVDKRIRDLVQETLSTLSRLVILSYIPLVYARAGGYSRFKLSRSRELEQ